MTGLAPAILCSARMANWGISILLLQLCAGRTLDIWRHRKLPVGGLPLETVNPVSLIMVGVLMGVSMVSSFSLRITHHLWHWPDSQQVRDVKLIVFWLIGAARIVLVYALAYHPRRKMIWCAGWVITSHIIILGALWTRIP